MKLSDKIQLAIRNPESEVHTIELTPEYQEHLVHICEQVIDEIGKRTVGPAEALMVVHFIKESLEEEFGITGFHSHSGEVEQ